MCGGSLLGDFTREAMTSLLIACAQTEEWAKIDWTWPLNDQYTSLEWPHLSDKESYSQMTGTRLLVQQTVGVNIIEIRQNYFNGPGVKCVFLTRPPAPVNKIDILRVRYHYSRDRVTIVSSLWRHHQSIVTSAAEQRPRKWDTGTRCKYRHSYRHLWIRYVV